MGRSRTTSTSNGKAATFGLPPALAARLRGRTTRNIRLRKARTNTAIGTQYLGNGFVSDKAKPRATPAAPNAFTMNARLHIVHWSKFISAFRS